MYSTFKQIASNRCFDLDKFTKFAQNEGKRYTVDDEGTSTWHANDLIEAYEEFRGAEFDEEFNRNFDNRRKGMRLS